MSAYITSVSAHGMKSSDFKLDLAPVTLIVGKSATRKTTILDAVRLGLKGATILGRNGELKSMRRDILDLSRNGEIEVRITDSFRQTNTHQWTSKETTEHCDIPDTPDVLIDSGEYFRLSPAKQLEYVFNCYNMADSDEFSGPAISAAVKNIKLDVNTEDTEKIIRKIVEEIDQLDQERHDRWDSIQELIAAIIAKFKEQLRLAKATSDRMTKTVQGITQISANSVAGRNPEAELSRQRSIANNLRKQVAELEASIKTANEKEAKLFGLSEQLAALPPMDSTVIRDEIEALQHRLEVLQSELDGYASQTHNLNLKISEMTWKRKSLVSEIETLRKDSCRRKKEFEDAIKENECPRCGAKSDHWTGEHTIAAQMDDHESRMKELFDMITAKIEESESLDIAILDLKKKVDESERLDSIFKGKALAIRDAQSHLDHLIKTERKILQNVADRRALESQLTQIENDIRDRVFSVKEIESNYRKAKDDLRTVETEIDLLQIRQGVYIRAQADEQRNARAIQEYATAQAEVNVLKSAIEALEGFQAKMVTSAFDRILKPVNRITSAVMPEPIEYRDGELGRWVGKSWVNHETFSGMEKAVTYAGISVALATMAPCRLVMIDELGRLDSENLRKLLVRMVELTKACLIDQFIGACSWELPGEPIDGVKIIRL